MIVFDRDERFAVFAEIQSVDGGIFQGNAIGIAGQVNDSRTSGSVIPHFPADATAGIQEIFAIVSDGPSSKINSWRSY